jgi:hypothetical protein
MSHQTRPVSPYDFLPAVPSFTVTSTEFADGEALPKDQLSAIFGADGADLSPSLSWSGFPEATKCFVVTCFDLDAPTGCGFWHWMVVDIPVGVTELPAGIGADGTGLPARARQLRNDADLRQFLGAAPPEGDGEHRYLFAVNALATGRLNVDDSVTPTLLSFNVVAHTVARAVITGTCER